MNLLVVFLVPPAGFDENETLGALGLLFAQCFALSVLDRDGVGVLIHVFERGKDFTQIPFDDFEERGDLVETRER